MNEQKVIDPREILSSAGYEDVPAVLLPYQQAWIEDKSQLKIAEKSRRIGLTWAEAADAVLDAASQDGQNCYYLGYNKDMTVEFIQACAMWAKAFDAACCDIEEGLWVSPPAGLSGTATDVSIGGGTDQEELEDWRARLLEAKQLGLSRDRAEDLESIIKTVANVKDVYVYPKRRGLGSLDVAITAVGNPPTLPSEALIASAQLVLDTYAGFWADCVVYSPTEQLVPVAAIISGSADLDSVRQVIRNYFAELEPVQSYQAAILTSRIVAIAGVTDVTLSPSSNIVPTVDPFYTKWLRLGTLTVSVA
ncbi:baseplate J/gp47 family protein [Acinetobacter beijerinckii]|uniref:baseplate J/gp47 family protein n=1 Tax=Acinetobacter beijerinckii TaxID=262668 RepID=UPI003AF6C535